jgi:tetratricopeptide (TPR) repeat protein
MNVATRIITLLALVAALSVVVVPAQADMVEDCVQEDDQRLRIRGCTEVIRSGQQQGEDLAAAYLNRGNGYFALNAHGRAKQDYDQALQLDPTFVPAYINRGNAYLRLRDPARAIEDYHEALRLDPDNAIAYNNRGTSYYTLGDDALGRDWWFLFLLFVEGERIRIDLNKLPPDAQYVIDLYDHAVEDYDQALRFDPGYAQAYNNRANTRCRLGQAEGSIDDRTQALRLGAISAESLQHRLRLNDFYKGAIDGKMGRALKAALREWTEAGCPETVQGRRIYPMHFSIQQSPI